MNNLVDKYLTEASLKTILANIRSAKRIYDNHRDSFGARNDLQKALKKLDGHWGELTKKQEDEMEGIESSL